MRKSLFLYWINMGNEICLLKNDTDQMIRMQKWNDRYNTETKGSAIYPEAEAELVVEAGKFISIDATKLDNLWLQKKRIFQVDLNLRVYMGSNTHHSLTLEVADFLIYGGIVFFKNPSNNELQKRFVSGVQLHSRLKQRRRAATGCCLLPRFFPYLRSKKQQIQEMDEEIDSILGSSVASRATDSCVHEDIGGDLVTHLMAEFSTDKCKDGSEKLNLMLLDKTGTNYLFFSKEPHERSPIHIGKPQNQFALGVKVKNQVKHKRATNDSCLLEIENQCTSEMEEKESPIMGCGGTSTDDYNGGHCNRESQGKPPTPTDDYNGGHCNRESQGKPPTPAVICDTAEEKSH